MQIELRGTKWLHLINSNHWLLTLVNIQQCNYKWSKQLLQPVLNETSDDLSQNPLKLRIAAELLLI